VGFSLFVPVLRAFCVGQLEQARQSSAKLGAGRAAIDAVRTSGNGRTGFTLLQNQRKLWWV